MEIGNSDVVTKENLVSQPYANIYNLLNNRNNVQDPLDSSGIRKFIYSRSPDENSNNFAGYPYIIISRGSPKRDDGEDSCDETKGDLIWEFEVMIRSSDKTRVSPGNGAYSCEQITNNILKTINNVSNRTTLRNYATDIMGISVDDFDTIELSNDVVFYSIITIRVKRRFLLS